MDHRSVEAGLSQKLITLENAAACVASSKASLRANVDSIRKEISQSISQQLSLIRAREQELLDQLDVLMSLKENSLSEQQQQIHTGIGTCQQVLESVRRNDGLPVNAVNILMKLNHFEHIPKDVGRIEFEKDLMKLRSSISSFGCLKTVSSHNELAPSGESLPREMEDYEDDVGMTHKSVFRFGTLNSERNGHVAPASTVQSWLKRIPSGAVALDADISALMAEFEVIKTTAAQPEDVSETSSYDVVSDAKMSSDSTSIVSSEFAKMLSRPLSDWLLQNGLSFADDSASQTSSFCSRTTKRRHSLDNPVKAKRYGFEEIIRNIQQSNAQSWFLSPTNDESEVECSGRDKIGQDESQLNSEIDQSIVKKIPEAEYIKRLHLMFKTFDPTWGSSSVPAISSGNLDQNSDQYWKQVVDKIQKSYNWLSENK